MADILLRAQLEAWQEHYGEDVFRVVFCVGSRWANVHWGVKTRGKSGEEYAAPPIPDGFQTLKHAEQVCYLVITFCTDTSYIFFLNFLCSFAV